MGGLGLEAGKSSRADIAALLERLRPVFEAEPALIDLHGSVAFVGDTHGDVATTKAILERFLGVDQLVFLGDFVDREPEPGWSLENVLTLFEAKLRHPEKIILLKGNHEANSIIPCFPCDFEREVEEHYGSEVAAPLTRVFNALPLMVLGQGVFGAHGGFPVDADLETLRAAGKTDRAILEYLLWSDPVVSQTFRGVGGLFTAEELHQFLTRIGASVFIRGHDYQRLGESIYNDTCLTIFSARQYKTRGSGGILVAQTSQPVHCASELRVEDFSTGEWRSYTINATDL